MQRPTIPTAHRPRNTAPPPPGTFRTKPCRHFEQGRCTWGTSCRFLHAAPPARGSPPSSVHPPPLQPQPLHSANAMGSAPSTPLSVRVGANHLSPNMGESTTTQHNGENDMPPTHTNTPAHVGTTPHGTPGVNGRYTHNPYQSSPLAPSKTSPGGNGSVPTAFEVATLLPLPKPLQQQQHQALWKMVQ